MESYALADLFLFFLYLSTTNKFPPASMLAVTSRNWAVKFTKEMSTGVSAYTRLVGPHQVALGVWGPYFESTTRCSMNYRCDGRTCNVAWQGSTMWRIWGRANLPPFLIGFIKPEWFAGILNRAYGQRALWSSTFIEENNVNVTVLIRTHKPPQISTKDLELMCILQTGIRFHLAWKENKRKKRKCNYVHFTFKEISLRWQNRGHDCHSSVA